MLFVIFICFALSIAIVGLYLDQKGRDRLEYGDVDQDEDDDWDECVMFELVEQLGLQYPLDEVTVNALWALEAAINGADVGMTEPPAHADTLAKIKEFLLRLYPDDSDTQERVMGNIRFV